jgi:thioredoxin-dependent peroxiredoxin
MTRVTLQGEAMYTDGCLPAPGRVVPKFTLTGADWSEVGLDRFGTRRKVVDILPSIDVPAFGAAARTLAQRLRLLPETRLLLVTSDLPFALRRWLDAEGLDNVCALSAFRSPAFARAWGVALVSGPMKGLLARATVVLDRDNRVLHAELERDIEQPPNQELIVAALQRAATAPTRPAAATALAPAAT